MLCYYFLILYLILFVFVVRLPGTTRWTKPPSKKGEKGGETVPFALHNINIAVPKGKFVAIVGQVGSGKSSVLNAMLGEMNQSSGSVQIEGDISYAAQVCLCVCVCVCVCVLKHVQTGARFLSPSQKNLFAKGGSIRIFHSIFFFIFF